MARKKVTVRTDNSTWKAPKVRKKRKPMTEEQKAAAAERLAKAREKNAAADPNYGQSALAECLRQLDFEIDVTACRSATGHPATRRCCGSRGNAAVTGAASTSTGLRFRSRVATTEPVDQ